MQVLCLGSVVNFQTCMQIQQNKTFVLGLETPQVEADPVCTSHADLLATTSAIASGPDTVREIEIHLSGHTSNVPASDCKQQRCDSETQQIYRSRSCQGLTVTEASATAKRLVKILVPL